MIETQKINLFKWVQIKGFKYTLQQYKILTYPTFKSDFLFLGLAKSLFSSGKGTLISNLVCSSCQKSLTFKKELENSETVSVWSCGHCFHLSCVRAADVKNICPQCRLRAVLLPVKKSSVNNWEDFNSNINFRPDLEGHF